MQCLEYRNVFFEQRNIFCSVVAIVCVGYVAIDIPSVIILYLPEKGDAEIVVCYCCRVVALEL